MITNHEQNGFTISHYDTRRGQFYTIGCILDYLTDNDNTIILVVRRLKQNIL